MADKFQPDFYLACATVIPVLFLAFAVQGKAFAWLLGFIKLLDPDDTQSGVEPPPPPVPRRQKTRETLAGLRSRETLEALRFGALAMLPLAVVAAGGSGEGLALYVLYRGSDLAPLRAMVLVATLVLVAAVVAVPAITAMWSLFPLRGDLAAMIAQANTVRLRRTVTVTVNDMSEAAEGPAPGRITEERES